MKNVLCILALLLSEKVIGQKHPFDSLKIYSINYYSNSGRQVDEIILKSYANTTLILDTTLINKIFLGLGELRIDISKRRQKKIRKNFPRNSIDLRLLFVFYSGFSERTIGLSNNSLMFIDNLIFEKEDKKLRDIIILSPKLYKSVFPTREDLLQ